MIRNIIFLLFGALFASFTFAAPEDIDVILREPNLLFRGSQVGKVDFLTAGALRAGFGGYLMGHSYQTWQFKSAADLVPIAFGEVALWRMGVGLQGLADTGNDIGFRLVQNHYEFYTAFEALFGPGVGYLGYRHRCRHGVDANNISRVVMRSGPEIGYKWAFSGGPLNFTWNSWANYFITGQNQRKDAPWIYEGIFQQRMLFGSVLQAEWWLRPYIGLFATLGLGVLVATIGADTYHLTAPYNQTQAKLSPAGALGVKMRGRAGDFVVFMNVQRNIDSGFSSQVAEVNALALTAEFLF